MKKGFWTVILSLILIILLFPLVGCGGNNNDGNGTDTEHSESNNTDVMYSLTFDFSGGTSESKTGSSYTTSVKEFSTEYFITDLTKEGYNFRGWTYEGELVVDQKGNLIKEPTLKDSMTFYAKFVNNVNLSININMPNAGNVVGAGEYEFNTQVNLIATTKEGYKFVGWFYQDNILSSQENYNYMM